MDSFQRAALNLRRLVVLAAVVALVLSVLGGLVIVAIRSADDAGTYAAHAALIVGALVVLSAVLGVIGRPLPRLARLRSSPGRSSEDPKGVLAALAALAPIARALGLVAERGALHADLEPEDWQIR